jgi:hypothetical protein
MPGVGSESSQASRDRKKMGSPGGGIWPADWPRKVVLKAQSCSILGNTVLAGADPGGPLGWRDPGSGTGRPFPISVAFRRLVRVRGVDRSFPLPI